jgi:hypothetical protein
MLLITEPFLPIVTAFGPTVGAPDYAAVAVPHPVSSLDDEELRKLASTVIDAAEARLTPSG